LLREGFARLVIHSGIAAAIRSLAWRDRTAILLYHDPDPETLDAHLTYLKKLCDIVPLAELGKPSAGRRRAVITLDDGHARNAQLLPVFIKHGVRPTIYLCSSIVAQPRVHWWMHPAAAATDTEQLKRLPNAERLAALARLGYRQDADARPSGLSREDIEAMRPYVDFQSHTRFHPILTCCSAHELIDEIAGSKREIEALAGACCEHFAYPNGNYGEREVAALRAAGYTTGRTCDIGWNDERTDPYRLRTFDIDDSSSLTWLAAQLTGIPLFLRYLRMGGGMAGRKPQFATAESATKAVGGALGG
jgi:peptidoglycan/xylan/chitin deacetylase (PgdA/CDA1 family)